MKATKHEVTTREVLLSMTEEQAGVVLELTAKIGGDPSGPRGVWDELRNALWSAGVKQAESTFEASCSPVYYKS